MRVPTASGPARRPAAGAPFSPPAGARGARVSAPDAAPGVSAPAGGDRDTGFPRHARLLDGKSFTPVFRKNKRQGDRYWTMLVHQPIGDASSGGARLGLAIAKKRAKRAVDRNRLKRVARESFRHHRAALGGRHIVLMNRDGAATASAAELRAGLDRLFARLAVEAAR